MKRTIAAALVGLSLIVGSLAAQDKGGTKKPADTKKADTPKDDKKAGAAIEAKIKSVDVAKNTVTVTLADGKDRTFTVTDDTKIVGPRGGVAEKRMKDDRFAAGMDITVTPAADGKKAANIELGVRKSEDEPKEKGKSMDKDKGKGKSKDKDKG